GVPILVHRFLLHIYYQPLNVTVVYESGNGESSESNKARAIGLVFILVKIKGLLIKELTADNFNV
ncbi:MAG: hypothetical protein ACTHLD_20045, partial [Chitinophaga sp.]